ncbi:MAG: carboxypeptidase-like regulatory domain-containing protein [Bacteroidota bacterium]
MKNIVRISALTCVSLLVLVALSTSSCKKDKTCYGKVTVVDTAGVPVAGATVRLGAPSVNGTKTFEPATTDGSGVANFELKLPAILDIEAEKPSAYPGMLGKGILRLDEPGKTAEVTVTLKP